MRHLPTMAGFPQPQIAHAETAKAIIRNPDACRPKTNGMTAGRRIICVFSAAGTPHCTESAQAQFQ